MGVSELGASEALSREGLFALLTKELQVPQTRSHQGVGWGEH